jgi:hypothetical protein
MGKLTIIELNYHCHDTVSVAEVVQLHWPSSGYLHLLKERAHVQLVKHLHQPTAQTIDGVPYLFLNAATVFGKSLLPRTVISNNKSRMWYWYRDWYFPCR